ncbi:hypothetical protein [Poriferisphaera sp. WC338]|uniref:hypothetical protein n=1 Tax=Poriferisphaera sp. WC338 TaxID=3425129 RepID=UPI003D814C91
MSKQIGKTTGRRLVEDMLDAKHDLKALAERYRLRVDDLSEWAAEQENAQTLAGLCYLADMQTQLMLSRFRLLAADRLVRLASGEDENASAEVSRKACVDLLKLDLKRAEGKVVLKSDTGGEETAVDAGELRGLLYGAADSEA